jgi:hypothetical protein
VKNARLLDLMPIHAGMLLRKELTAKILIAGSVMFIE